MLRSSILFLGGVASYVTNHFSRSHRIIHLAPMRDTDFVDSIRTKVGYVSHISGHRLCGFIVYTIIEYSDIYMCVPLYCPLLNHPILDDNS